MMKKIMPAVGACLAVLMTIICVGAANISTKIAAQPPIPKASPLAQPKSPQQVGLPVDQTRAGHTTGQSANA
jgi:hypothetical protein